MFAGDVQSIVVRFVRRFSMGLFLVLPGCLEKYPTPEGSNNLNILVVDGFFNATDSTVVVSLLHTTALNATEPALETGAVVTLVDNSNNELLLKEIQPGYYVRENVSARLDAKYRLEIRTVDGQGYSSEESPVLQTPPIDGITWKAEDEGVGIYISTHDDSGLSQYYRWQYAETWEYHAPFYAELTTLSHQIVQRDRKDIFYTCYKTVPSKKITVANSVKLSSDVIHEHPLSFLPVGSDQLMIRYSIIATQRVLGKKEFEYWSSLQKVTEGLGGLFDSQPYQIVGNVHHESDASRPVLGYFSAATTDTQRIFIELTELPNYLKKRPYHGCALDTLLSIYVRNMPDGLDIVTAVSKGGFVVGYTYATADCADCRRKGGTLDKPSFWP